MIRYSLLRVLVFLGCLALLWLVGLRSQSQAALLFLGAALVSLPVSYVVLRPFREDYSRQIAERVQARRAAKEGRVSDEDVEDAEIAGGSVTAGLRIGADGGRARRADRWRGGYAGRLPGRLPLTVAPIHLARPGPGGPVGEGDTHDDTDGDEHGVPHLEQPGAGQHGDEPLAGRPAADHRDEAPGHRGREQGEQGPWLPPGHGGDADEGEQQQGGIQPTGPGVPEPDGEGVLARPLIGGDVAQVVGHEDRRGEHADPDRPDEPEPARRPGLGVLGPQGGHEPEEDEHVHLAQPAVAVGVLAPRVPPGRQDRERPQRQQPPGVREGDQDDPDHPGARERPEGGELDRARLREPLSDEPHRTDPGGVGAANPVGVVVGVVDADLEGEGDEQRQRGIPEPGVPGLVGGGGSEDDGCDGGREGPGPGTGDPLVRGGHGWARGLSTVP